MFGRALLIVLLLLGLPAAAQHGGDTTSTRRDLVRNTTVPVTDGMLVTGLYYVVDSGYGYPRLHPYGEVYVDPSPIVTVGNYAGITLDETLDGAPAVEVRLDAAGTARWHVATQRSVKRRIAVVVRNTVVSAPVVQSGIANGRCSFGTPKGGPLGAAEYVQLLRAEQPHVPAIR